ncbi:MAG TPA: sulfotransferase [Solirubrobacterales bacterium]|nr:sulfotransferase [Solirubrobacterales bacterium]
MIARGQASWRHPVFMASRLRRRIREPKRQPAPFVVGVNRSGTTLLRMMLDAHPQLTIPPETHFIPEVIRRANHENTRRRLIRSITKHPRWGDFGLDEAKFRARAKQVRPLTASGAIRCFYELYAEQQGKPRWGDKTPRYMRAMPRIARALPEARFIHLIRDGRDVALSQRERVIGGEDTSMAAMAERWQRRIVAAREGADEIKSGVYLEIRYEDLVSDTEGTLRRICEFVELEFDPEMLDYHRRAEQRLAEMNRDLDNADNGIVRTANNRLAAHALTTEPPTTNRCGRWRSEMTPAELTEFEGVAGQLLAELGYELSGDRAIAGEGVE